MQVSPQPPESAGLNRSSQPPQHDQWLRDMERAWLQSWIQQSVSPAGPAASELQSRPGLDPRPAASLVSPHAAGASNDTPSMDRKPDAGGDAPRATTAAQLIVDKPGPLAEQGKQHNLAKRDAMAVPAQRPGHDAIAAALPPPPAAEPPQLPLLSLAPHAAQSLRPGEVPAHESARASRVPAPAPSQPAPLPGALHWREPQQGCIQASLCAPWMGELASRQAADSLAYALMQAGYQRAQVYVNGNRQVRQREAEADTASSPALARNAAPFPITSQNPVPESSHGH